MAERCVVRVEQLSQKAADPDRPASSPKASVRSERQFGQKAASNITNQERNIPEAPATHYVLIRLSLQEEFRATATSQAKNQVYLQRLCFFGAGGLPKAGALNLAPRRGSGP